MQTENRKLKIGVLGAGHLGKIHLKQIREIREYDLIGFYDSDDKQAKLAAKETGAKAIRDFDEIVSEAEVIDIVTPTTSHFKYAVEAIEAGKHVFIEKPLTYTLEEADILVKKVRKSGVKAQVGHVERFNPAFLAAQEEGLDPAFIEATRISQYNPRGTDVSVVLDLMIHDLDLVLHLINSEISHVSASGVPVVSDTPDIANARIEFENGYVANLTASRASLKNERKMRIFQKNAYFNINFLEKKLDIIRINELKGINLNPLSMTIDPGNGKPKKQVTIHKPKVPEINAIREELRLFAMSIMENTEPVVTIEDGFRSLRLAYIILEKINEKLNKISFS